MNETSLAALGLAYLVLTVLCLVMTPQFASTTANTGLEPFMASGTPVKVNAP